MEISLPIIQTLEPSKASVVLKFLPSANSKPWEPSPFSSIPCTLIFGFVFSKAYLTVAPPLAKTLTETVAGVFKSFLKFTASS